MGRFQETTYVSERGTLTLPASIRRAMGLKGKQQMLVETTSKGEILLRPAVTVPIEYYTEARIAEFTRDEAFIGQWLKKRKSSRKSLQKRRPASDKKK